MARHGIHVSEVLEASIQTLEAIQICQIAINKTMISELRDNYGHQADEYGKFQVQSLRSLKLRAESNNKRLENEVTLVHYPSSVIDAQAQMLISAGVQHHCSFRQHCDKVHYYSDHVPPTGNILFGMCSCPLKSYLQSAYGSI